MAQQIGNNISVEIQRNGEVYEFGSGNVLEHVSLQESAMLFLPLFDIAFQDHDKAWEQDGVTQDALPVTITIWQGEPSAEILGAKFRTFSSQTSYNGTAKSYYLDGYYDAPMFWDGTAKEKYSGTSSSILRKISQTCGLTFQGDTTSDQRAFYGMSTKYKDLARKVTRSAYGSSDSCYRCGVTLEGKFLFYDIVKLLLKGNEKRKLVSGNQAEEGEIAVLSFQQVSASGSMNAAGGYNNTYVAQSLTQTGKTISKLNLKIGSNVANLNKDIKTGAGNSGKKTFSPISVSSYDQVSNFEATYQNTRIGKLFSYELALYLNTPTDLHIFDVVQFSAIGPDGAEDKARSGRYIVTNRTIHIIGNQYSEILAITRMGSN